MKNNSNNYNPVSAVAFSLVVVFILPIITAILIGVSYSFLGTSGTDSAFEVWMQQNPVEVSILSDEKTIISPVESAVSYLITVPLQIWFIFWLLRRRKIDLSKNLGLYHFNRNALIYSLVAYLILYLVLTAYSYAFQISPPEEFIKLMQATPFVLNFLMVVIGAPIVEELLFRGFLFS